MQQIMETHTLGPADYMLRQECLKRLHASWDTPLGFMGRSLFRALVTVSPGCRISMSCRIRSALSLAVMVGASSALAILAFCASTFRLVSLSSTLAVK